MMVSGYWAGIYIPLLLGGMSRWAYPRPWNTALRMLPRAIGSGCTIDPMPHTLNVHSSYQVNQTNVIRIPYHYATHVVCIAYYQYEDWRFAIGM